MYEFFENNASAFFALLGAFGGALITFVSAWALSKRDYDLKLWDRLLDRRMHAHDNLIRVAIEMRVMVGDGTVDAKGQMVRGPRVLTTQQGYEDWFGESIEAGVAASTWLSTKAKREANYLQDYLATLFIHLKEVPSEQYLVVGSVIRQDFIDISSRLEKASFAFFEKEVRELKMGNLKEWHKYPPEVTRQRLEATALITKGREIREALGLEPSDEAS